MKNLITAAALSLSTLLAAQACLAEESAAFVAHQQAHQQQPHTTATQQAQTTGSQSTDHHG
ncbi:Uncharacterised protein [Ectopseudomonas mendocina]|uniref:hypothetical protein n=1 Tax=Pseudomonadaceae TaxID=135621 RepID=UPI000DFD58B9|nr:hypothetical protein [Pseudomonas mendocina]QTN44435.1 hypothetical protein H7683_15730 [Pseudomonas mendocina]SUD65541.1 Uncharacterised protein [Pseudomonas mendocina]